MPLPDAGKSLTSICFDTTPECDGQTVRRVTITISRCTCMEMLTRDKKGIFLYVIPTDYGYVRSWVIMDMGSSRPDQYHIRIYGQLFLWWNFCRHISTLTNCQLIPGFTDARLMARYNCDSSTIRVRFEHDSSTACYNTLRGFSCARIRVRYEHPTRNAWRRVIQLIDTWSLFTVS